MDENSDLTSRPDTDQEVANASDSEASAPCLQRFMLAVICVAVRDWVARLERDWMP